MFVSAKPNRSWSVIGLRILIFCVVGVVVLALADGIFKAYATQYVLTGPRYILWATWIVDFRYILEQGVYTATIFFIGAKFIEMRSVLTIGFDKLDAEKIKINGPDEANVVWIGHAYTTAVEAQAVADTMKERIKQSAV